MKRKRFLRSLLLFGSATFFSRNRLWARTPAFFVNKVKFVFAGGTTSSAASVRAKLTAATGTARLVVSTNQQLSNPVFGSFAGADAANNYVAKLSVSGLLPHTDYYYGIEADGVIDTAAEAIGHFRTMAAGPQSFRFTVASCNFNGNHPVFHRIREKDPLFHITHGDFHYSDANSASDINVHRAPLEATLSQPAMKELLRHVPMAYIWDDHDYCGDNTNSFAAGRKNARLAYQEYVAHYPLPAGAGDVPIYQCFTAGRVTFILTDLRSEKGAAGTSIMGAAQKAWFKNQCLQAKSNNNVIVWINSTPWGGTTESDAWAGYPAERTELSDFFQSTGIQNLLIVCGDIHMIAFDDGRNYDFSTGSNNPFKYPLLQAAAVNQSGSYRGGTYSHGYFLNPSRQHGQYAALDITDNGGSNIGINITGYRVDSAGSESVLLTHTINFPVLSTLPLRILHFSVAEGEQKGSVLLRWETADDATSVCKTMVIERSEEGDRYSAIGTMNCNTTAGGTERYTFTDFHPLYGKAYYRIKLIGQDNEVVYSPVRSITSAQALAVEMLNNPVRQQLQLSIQAPVAEAATYTLADGAGRTIRKGKISLIKGTNRVTVDVSSPPAGVYFFNLQTRKGQVVKKFLRE